MSEYIHLLMEQMEVVKLQPLHLFAAALKPVCSQHCWVPLEGMAETGAVSTGKPGCDSKHQFWMHGMLSWLESGPYWTKSLKELKGSRV